MEPSAYNGRNRAAEAEPEEKGAKNVDMILRGAYN